MIDPVDELKTRAELLHHAVRDGIPAALERLRALTELRKASAETLERTAPEMQRKHCLTVVAREAGFGTWDHARRVLDGEGEEADFGRLLYPDGWSSTLHPWFATYADAREAFEAPNGERKYLLAYQRHFFIAQRPFVEALGLNPDDPDWEAIGWDWARPRDVAARRRLYGKLLEARRR
jgi:hypothetical protein